MRKSARSGGDYHDPPVEPPAHVSPEDRAGPEWEMYMRKIYLAGSWKNAGIILTLQDLLIAEGHQVDCFASTKTGRTSFSWAELTQGLGCTTREEAEEKLCQMDAIDLLKFNRVIQAFDEDKKWLDWCDTCILILPSGKSAHLEAGYAKGHGKDLIIFGEFLKGERDVMYGFADALIRGERIDQLIQYLSLPCEPDPGCRTPGADHPVEVYVS